MKLKEFLENPAGKGDSSTNRTVLRQLLDSKYDKLMDKKSLQFKVNVYHIAMTDNYYIHMVIPTETERDNSYDVVLLFESEKGSSKDVSLLHTHNVRFFCNAPSFAYTFAKVFDNEGLLITGLKNKYPDEIFGNDPETRNRYGIVNYDKYLYFGCKYVYERKLLNRATLKMRSNQYGPMSLIQVRTLDKIMIEYKKAQNKLKKEKAETTRERMAAITRAKTKGSGVREIQKKQPMSKHTTHQRVTKKHKKT